MEQTYPKPKPISPYFGHEDLDRWGKVILELLSQVWALNQRVHRLEGSLLGQGIDLQSDDSDKVEEHQERRSAFLQQTLWPFLDAEVTEPDNAKAEDQGTSYLGRTPFHDKG